uniref:NADH-ubiquinone oxidoreductase chain 5 n=1 Tax=Uroplatus fimbriatus TaxID=402375 RepID=A0A0A1H7B0_9SAUR|nr:NADH dehydrogenase subunit 5 [Uroplatus fimbriatus]BAP90253.1 NADH dehydrogenase subunit 5 [Uroplatus fimbriatus]
MPNLFYSTLIMLLLMLLSPILSLGRPVNNIKLASITSALPTAIFIHQGTQMITTHITWNTMCFNWHISLLFDMYTVIFIPMALFITWAIMQFSLWYMAQDPLQDKFMMFLLLFLIAMIVLTTTQNMLQLFIGWEAVGVMSFLLINWWNTRANANTAALQAIIYNRTGDIGFILTLAWTAMNCHTWDLQQLFSHNVLPTLPLLGLILAAAGKSAQFGLHPWLPSAMEGPTPVSALLHSSTMVVAGVLLLIRCHPLLEASPVALTICLCMGATTTTFAALCAATQNDLKKIIAFSTTSQLGLMMLAIGLNQPTLAFLHITTHAFFKALLFLCAGSIIHNTQDEQDIRKMGHLLSTLPITMNCMTLAALALMGTPFLAGFYTKDIMIESALISKTNAWALLITLLTTALTATYSMRLMFFAQLSTPRTQTVITMNETAKNLTGPLLRLAYGSIFTGLLTSIMLLPSQTQPMTMPLPLKLLALTMTLLGAILAVDTVYQTTHFCSPANTHLHTTLTHACYFNTISHRTAPMLSLKMAQNMSLHLKDLAWYETLIPLATKLKTSQLTTNISLYHTGTIKTHFMPVLLIMMSLSCLKL